MNYVLITLSGGIIDQVIFHDDPSRALKDLAEYVQSMNGMQSKRVKMSFIRITKSK